MMNTQVVTYNVRGLGDAKKVRHLINKCYKLSSSSVNSIFLFQEVYSTKLDLIKYIWRGEHHLTPGLGNSLGCLTLVTAPHKIIHTRDIGNRAHVLVLTKDDPNRTEMLIVNAYAPNGYGQVKQVFFDELTEAITELIADYNCANLILGGDLNLVMCEEETKNSTFSQPERRIAQVVKDLFQLTNLTDGWEAVNK